ncbi:MAG: protein kinase domain-containing protein [Anaerolineae bacterium]
MLQPNTQLQNRYLIRRRIGGGGMGTVYIAEDMRLQGRQCAVKEMSPSALAPQDREWSIEAFRQEAQMLAQLRHPGLTAVTDFFGEGGNWYLVMDYVEGKTLATKLSEAPEGRFPVQEALRIVRQLCDVLEYLHNQPSQVIFRDLKPGNVMVTAEGQVKLIDFGIARFFKPGKQADTALLGTPGYAAPEQYGGLGQSGPQTDIYSLGVLLCHMVTGFDPVSAMSPFPIPDPTSLMPGIPPRIAATIVRATQLRPELRYRSIAEMRDDLFPPSFVPYKPPTERQRTQVMQPSAPSEAGSDRKRLRMALLAGGAGIALLGICVGLGVFVVWPYLRPDATVTPTVTPTQAAATATFEATATVGATASEESVTPTETPAEVDTDTPPPPVVKVDQDSLGLSVQGRALAVTTIGYEDGADIVVVGSIQGDQAGTRDLVQALIDHYRSNEGDIPMGVMYHFVPSINPDGLTLNSRYNARDVDLNRNWGSSDWLRDAAVPGYPEGKPDAGGAAPFSEPETQALRDYLLSLRSSSDRLRVMILHSSVRRDKGEVYPGGATALDAAQSYANVTGYDVEYAWAEYVTSGEAVTWCEEQSIVSIDVVIPGSQTPSTKVIGDRTLLQITLDAVRTLGQ